MKTAELIFEEQKRFFKGKPLETGGTSINAGTEAPALRILEKQGLFDGDLTIIDYGAGKYGRNANYLRKMGHKVYAYDPYNGTASDGWTGVSSVLPKGVKFDIGFTAYVLNVVPEGIETQIIRDVEKLSKHQFHITRNKDIFPTVRKAIDGNFPMVTTFIKNEYDPNYNPKVGMSDEQVNKLIDFGVQTARGFQRLPHLEEKGYRLLKRAGGYKIYSK